MTGVYNLKNPAVKRLMREAEELRYPTEEYFAQPLESNLFEWHFTVRGPPNTDFDGGIYHGRLTLPADYPMKPPNIIILTPNGRFVVNSKICLSISGHHPESWQPSWSIRTALLAIIGFMPTHGDGAVGSLDYTPEERRKLALKSQQWSCNECGLIKKILKEISTSEIKSDFSLCSTKSVNSELSNETDTNSVQEVDIRPQFSFVPNVGTMFNPLNQSGPSNLTPVVSTDEVENFQARQRTFSTANQPRPTPVLVETLSHISTDSQNTFRRTITTICIYFVAFLLGLLIFRRLFFYY